jgi:hypothetical protein
VRPNSGAQDIASLPADRFPHIVAMAVPLPEEARLEFWLDALVRGMQGAVAALHASPSPPAA